MRNNLYESHPFMINSGTLWRCDHGSTGYYACWRCGWRHPIQFLKHWWDAGELV